MASRYHRSEELLERALKTIPLGSQTFSKSKTQFPFGVSPYFIERGEGAHVWDVDGNKYIDFMNGLLSVSLGYNDPDVTAAVKEQFESGVTFSLPHRLEMEVSELLVDMIPCAEMVRFGKNGTDATSGAIRLARAYTDRDHVAVCGYHGWQDWYIGTTSRNKGVPKAVQGLSHVFQYNDLDSLRKIFESLPNQVAAVMMEPMNIEYPNEGYLAAVKALAHENGALLIFDETITGCRFAQGGAQELFNVTPDLATFGKGLGNGFPLSAVVGRAEVMKVMEEVFFSGTFAGETASLAAARTVLHKIRSESVPEKLERQGKKIIEGVERLIAKHDLADVLSISGHPSWSIFNFKDVEPYSLWDIKTLFFQEVFQRGIITIGTHNMSYAHTDDHIAYLLDVYDEVFPIIATAVKQQTLLELLRTEPLEPLFKVR